jgi:hypothetical protein
MKERGFYENSLLSRYKNIRNILSRDPNALEVKITVKGLIQ